MTDDREKLQHALGELESALAGSPGLSAEGRERLEHALADIRAALAQVASDAPTAEASDEDLTLRERLAEAAAEFEGDHPSLGGTLRSVIDALAQIGI